MLKFNLWLLSFAIPRILAGVGIYHKDIEYDAGNYGENPVQTYISTDIVSPSLNILQWSSECDDGLYVMLTPRGGAVKEPGAMILDSKGQLIWWKGGYNQVYNLMAQKWNGKQYLSFWAGNDAVGGHGAGFFYMLDDSYNEVLKISAAGGLDGDLHDFQITDKGTVLITVYEVIAADLSAFGKSAEGAIWDCLIQEIDITSRALIFQWRSSDHYKISDTYRDISDTGTPDKAFDYFHINSVAKDGHGNYLISSRYMRSITYISGSTGKIIWILGGKGNSFTDLSNGSATDFSFQHDARWQDSTTITVFDNSAEDGQRVGEYSRGMKIKLDIVDMTAELITSYVNPNKIVSISQGSMQTLPNNDVILGYGNSGAWTQFSDNGTVLCDVHFGPMAQFGWSKIQSYRVYKFHWRGYPTTKPAVKIMETDSGNHTSVFVSWNGDTEVVKWVLQGAMWNESIFGGWKELQTVRRTGFETAFDLGEENVQYLRVFGFDKKGNMLGASEALESGRKVVWNFNSWSRNFEKPSPLKFLWIFLLFTAVFISWKEYKIYRARVNLERRSTRLLRWKPFEGNFRID